VWLLLLQQPHLISYLREEYKHSGQKLFIDEFAFEALSDIFKRMLEDEELDRVFLIIDALDECDEASRPSLIRFLNTVLCISSICSKVKWLVSSRPLVEIEKNLKGTGASTKSFLKLDEHNLERPINAYIDYKVLQLRNREAYDDHRLRFVAVELRKRASNTFLWVALVCKKLIDAEEYVWEEILKTVPKDLMELYDYLLQRIETLEWKTESEYCKSVLAAATLAYRPLTLGEIGMLAGLPSGVQAWPVVKKCGSFLTVRSSTAYLIHQSAQDYLSKHYRKLHDVAPSIAHLAIFERCLKGMGSLENNIYGLPNFGITSREVQIPSPDPLRSVRYACQYWVHHLEQSECSINDQGEVYRFLQEHFLHWLEALSLVGVISESIALISTLESLVEVSYLTECTCFRIDVGYLAGRKHRTIMFPLRCKVVCSSKSRDS